MTTTLKEMNDYDLMHAIIDGDRPVVAALVEIGSKEAGPMTGYLEGYAQAFAGKALFVVVDVEENPTLSKKFGHDGHPSIAVFIDGKHVATGTGLSVQTMGDFLREHLGGHLRFL